MRPETPPTSCRRHEPEERLEIVSEREPFTRDVSEFEKRSHSWQPVDLLSGSSAIAVMTKAGHRNMATMRTYLHLAGTVFRDEAERLEARLLGATEW